MFAYSAGVVTISRALVLTFEGADGNHSPVLVAAYILVSKYLGLMVSVSMFQFNLERPCSVRKS